jgi:hypothetical protein
MINQINKKGGAHRRHPHTSSNKNRWQGAQEALKQKQDRGQSKKKINDYLTGSQGKGHRGRVYEARVTGVGGYISVSVMFQDTSFLI